MNMNNNMNNNNNERNNWRANGPFRNKALKVDNTHIQKKPKTVFDSVERIKKCIVVEITNVKRELNALIKVAKKFEMQIVKKKTIPTSGSHPTTSSSFPSTSPSFSSSSPSSTSSSSSSASPSSSSSFRFSTSSSPLSTSLVQQTSSKKTSSPPSSTDSTSSPLPATSQQEKARKAGRNNVPEALDKIDAKIIDIMESLPQVPGEVPNALLAPEAIQRRLRDLLVERNQILSLINKDSTLSQKSSSSSSSTSQEPVKIGKTMLMQNRKAEEIGDATKLFEKIEKVENEKQKERIKRKHDETKPPLKLLEWHTDSSEKKHTKIMVLKKELREQRKEKKRQKRWMEELKNWNSNSDNSD